MVAQKNKEIAGTVLLVIFLIVFLYFYFKKEKSSPDDTPADSIPVDGWWESKPHPDIERGMPPTPFRIEAGTLIMSFLNEPGDPLQDISAGIIEEQDGNNFKTVMNVMGQWVYKDGILKVHPPAGGPKTIIMELVRTTEPEPFRKRKLVPYDFKE